jgi:hypothetical protein
MAVHKIFLLSPAYCGGRRANILLKPKSEIAAAKKLAAGTLTLGEAFAFMSGLYFRGKLAYANEFGRIAGVRMPASAGASRPPNPAVWVITPTRGLQSPDTVVTGKLLREFGEVDVDTNDRRYRRPLDRDLKKLASILPNDAQVILLGSIATGKYVDALVSALGARLHFPGAFVGRGDMSRGGLLLRSVASGVELDYTPLLPNVARHGARPPKLEPLR